MPGDDTESLFIMEGLYQLTERYGKNVFHPTPDVLWAAWIASGRKNMAFNGDLLERYAANGVIRRVVIRGESGQEFVGYRILLSSDPKEDAEKIYLTDPAIALKELSESFEPPGRKITVGRESPVIVGGAYGTGKVVGYPVTFS